MNELVVIKKSVIGGIEINTVDARELHEFLEVGTRFDIWFDRRVKEYDFIINSDFCSFLIESSGGRPSTEYCITLDMAKELSMVENNEKGRDARKYFIQCEKRLKEIAVPQSYADALRAYANEIEMKELALKQRDEAIRTRAWISDKKTATAMNTASIKAKENERLKEQIGDSKNFKQVKAIPWLKEFFDLTNKGVYISLGNTLAKLTKALRYDSLTLESSQYPNGIKAYHRDVIESLRHKLINDKNMMRKYRL